MLKVLPYYSLCNLPVPFISRLCYADHSNVLLCDLSGSLQGQMKHLVSDTPYMQKANCSIFCKGFFVYLLPNIRSHFLLTLQYHISRYMIPSVALPQAVLACIRCIQNANMHFSRGLRKFTGYTDQHICLSAAHSTPVCLFIQCNLQVLSFLFLILDLYC